MPGHGIAIMSYGISKYPIKKALSLELIQIIKLTYIPDSLLVISCLLTPEFENPTL